MQMNASTSPDPTATGASIRLDVDHFVHDMNMLGHTTWQARAAFIGVDPSSMTRAREGGRLGGKFIAGTRLALEPWREWFAARNTDIDDRHLFIAVGSELEAVAERVA
jgi:hypothetical protein